MLFAIYVDFDRTRYFSAGQPVLLGDGTFEQVGERSGLPVYRRAGDHTTIYIPVQPGTDLLARYAAHR